MSGAARAFRRAADRARSRDRRRGARRGTAALDALRAEIEARERLALALERARRAREGGSCR